MSCESKRSKFSQGEENDRTVKLYDEDDDKQIVKIRSDFYATKKFSKDDSNILALPLDQIVSKMQKIDPKKDHE